MSSLTSALRWGRPSRVRDLQVQYSRQRQRRPPGRYPGANPPRRTGRLPTISVDVGSQEERPQDVDVGVGRGFWTMMTDPLLPVLASLALIRHVPLVVDDK